MKVLQIINSLNVGGAEKLLVDSIPLYQKKGIEMDLLTLIHSHTSFYEKLKSESQGKLFSISSKSVYNPFIVFKIIPYLKKYDLVHVHLFPALYWVVLAKILSFSKTKLVYTEHNTNNRRRNKLIFKLSDRFIYSKLYKIIAITEGVKIELKNHLNNKKKILVINNGIDVATFNLKVKPDFQYFTEEDVKIIQVSSFRIQKDQKTLIKSLKYLSDDVKLLLVGEGNLMEYTKKIVSDLNLSDRVLFLGNRSDIPELMNYADIVVLSSHWEGFGLAILEGMAARKPSIATDIEGVREIVQGYGLLFEQGNSHDLAEKIRSLIDNPAYKNEIAEKCYQRAKEFDIHVMVEKYCKLYNNL